MAQFGLDQIGNEPPKWMKITANTFIILAAVVTAVIAPMPTEWIPNEVKVYILTVTSSGGVLKIFEKLTGKEPEKKMD